MAVVSLAVSVLAVLLAVVAFLDGRRQAHAANLAADRAATAAEKEVALAEQAAQRYPNPWQFTAEGQYRRILINVSDEPAVEVTVASADGTLAIIDPPTSVDIGPGSAVAFTVAPDAATKLGSRIRVTWRRAAETAFRSWEHPAD